MSKENNHQKRLKRGTALLTLALVAALPFASMAESTTQAPQAADGKANVAIAAKLNGRGGMGRFPGIMNVDTSKLTDEQKATYESALSLYEQVEDAVLKDLVTANVVTQADVDAYAALRTAQKSLSELDQTNWTPDQYKAFYEANTKTGDERKAAMQALADAGQLTQDQANALSAQGGTGLWAKIAQNANTNSAIQTAVGTMRQALAKFVSTLRDAGIQGMGKGVMFGGFKDGAMKFGQNVEKNGMPMQPKGGKGVRN
jgi:hypothetical protein